VSNQFFNQSLPQTLVISQLLCYVAAFLGIIDGVVASSRGVALLIIFGLIIGAVGIANERKWGYYLAVGASGLHVVMYIIVFGGDVFMFNILIGFLFDLALFALLLHPQSRNHQKVYFH
jgi:hypothetical protein